MLTSESLSSLYDTGSTSRVRDRIVVGTPDDFTSTTSTTDVHGSLAEHFVHRALAGAVVSVVMADQDLRRHPRRFAVRSRAQVYRRGRSASDRIDPVIVDRRLPRRRSRAGLLSIHGRESDSDQGGARLRARPRRAVPLALPGVCDRGDEPAVRASWGQRSPLRVLVIVGAVVLIGIAVLYRPLLFSSVTLSKPAREYRCGRAIATFLLLALRWPRRFRSSACCSSSRW